jgi:hypothetical protein
MLPSSENLRISFHRLAANQNENMKNDVRVEKAIEGYKNLGLTVDTQITPADKFFGKRTDYHIHASHGGDAASVFIIVQERGGLNKRSSVRRSAYFNNKKEKEQIVWRHIDRMNDLNKQPN